MCCSAALSARNGSKRSAIFVAKCRTKLVDKSCSRSAFAFCVRVFLISSFLLLQHYERVVAGTEMPYSIQDARDKEAKEKEKANAKQKS